MGDGLRSGIIGAGFIGGVHAHAVRAAGGQLVAVADHSPEAAKGGAARLGARAAAESAEALIEADDVDVVHICTPNHLHAPLARLALRAGKAVVCEKPLATTLADAEEIGALATEHGSVTAVPFVYRYYQSVLEARARVRSGEVGQLWLLHGSYLQDWLSTSSDVNWRVDASLGGASRAFADIGVHWCDLVEFVSGHRIVRLSAQRKTAIASRESAEQVSTEDIATVQFETDLGAVGSVVVSQVSPGRKNRLWFSLDGAEQSLSFDQENPETLWVGSRAHASVVPRGVTPRRSANPLLEPLPPGHPQGYQDCFNALVGDLYQAVSSGSAGAPEELPGFADGVRAARITQAVLDSVATESWVPVG
ncbi:Gfo/Idh/MocA family oxidoreductase [Nocardioides aquiterrae]|uniref:Gfo/Idh/MocA family oxidoreductase n=1 Tax=Nocardioides aquiterrae TaxID=203799 RepID=A0ABN1UEA3_9ACTN